MYYLYVLFAHSALYVLFIYLIYLIHNTQKGTGQHSMNFYILEQNLMLNLIFTLCKNLSVNLMEIIVNLT